MVGNLFIVLKAVISQRNIWSESHTVDCQFSFLLFIYRAMVQGISKIEIIQI